MEIGENIGGNALMAQLSGHRLEVRAKDDWGWWYKVGHTYRVVRLPYRATKDATLDYCACAECEAERFGKSLHQMYAVVLGPQKGSMIPVGACDVLWSEQEIIRRANDVAKRLGLPLMTDQETQSLRQQIRALDAETEDGGAV